MEMYQNSSVPKSGRIDRLIHNLYEKMPVIESARAKLLTQSYQATEQEPLIMRRAKAFAHILKNIPIVIREEELIVGSTTIHPRSAQTYPEFSWEWLEAEFNTIQTRSADPFYISEQTKEEIREANAYWAGRTTSELAASYMEKETLTAIEHNLFTAGNYFYNGVGHVCVQYDKVLAIGYEGIIAEALQELDRHHFTEEDYTSRSQFLKGVILSCRAAIDYAKRYAQLAAEMAEQEPNPLRKAELLQISRNCMRVPARGATSFYEACQSFWFVQQLLQIESSGHSISPGRFDQYMYPYYKKDVEAGRIAPGKAQELLDCIWVKFNDLNKCRDAASAEGFAGYSLFQNMISGGQTQDGEDATNELSFMTLEASMHTQLPQPSLSVRVWNGSPHSFLQKAAELTRTGVGLPAYYNDEVIIPSLMNRGLTLQDARDYCIIGCVEPQKPGRTEGWHDAAFFNMCRPLELVFSNGMDQGKLVGIRTGALEELRTFEDFFEAYQKQTEYGIQLMVNADNAIDMAHRQRAPLPFLASMVDDCIARGKTTQEGGAVYNFTGPQGFGVANMADSLYTIRTLVYEQQKITLMQLKEALDANFGQSQDAHEISKIVEHVLAAAAEEGQELTAEEVTQIAKSLAAVQEQTQQMQDARQIHEMIEELPKFGNDIAEVDALARKAAYAYTRPLEKYKNPRGGHYQAGLYPVSANVPLGAQTQATPDGRFAGTPVADGVSPSAGRDVNGPTAAANSVSVLDHGIASNGTLFNQKFHPSALSGKRGIANFIALIKTYFEQKGSHMQFNVVSRDTLLEAQKNPEKYKNLVVRVAGYSAMFTTLSRSLQDDIINRTEQGM
ncbi:MAG: glycyl radical protein [Lachnospiraceae bacterium]